jgi:hypothetical protein
MIDENRQTYENRSSNLCVFIFVASCHLSYIRAMQMLRDYSWGLAISRPGNFQKGKSPNKRGNPDKSRFDKPPKDDEMKKPKFWKDKPFGNILMAKTV